MNNSNTNCNRPLSLVVNRETVSVASFFALLKSAMSNTLTTLVKLRKESGGFCETSVTQVEERHGLHLQATTSMEMKVFDGCDFEREVCPHYRRCTVKHPPHASQPNNFANENARPVEQEETSVEVLIFEELKRLRTNPKIYLNELQRLRTGVVGSTLWNGGAAVRLTEGPSVIDDAMSAMLRYCGVAVAPPPMVLERGLSFAARDLAFDVGPKGLLDQRGTDESSVSDRVERYGEWDHNIAEVAVFGIRGNDPVDIIAQILINDGVPSRIHRQMILNADLTHVGVCLAPHTKATSIVVIVLAQSFAPNSMEEMTQMHKTVATSLLPAENCAYCLGGVDLKRCVYGLGGRPFHRNCFLCKVCKSTLNKSFFERCLEDGTSVALCKDCVMFRAPPACANCKGRLHSVTPQFKRDNQPLCSQCFLSEAKNLAEPFPTKDEL